MVSRRTLLKVAGQGMISYAALKLLRPRFVMADLLTTTTARIKNLIVINMEGGCDVLAALPFYIGTAAATTIAARRPNINVSVDPSNSGLRLHDNYGVGFHPSFAPLHQRFLDGNMLVCYGFGNKESWRNRSHDVQQKIIQFGRTNYGPTSKGWISQVREFYGFDRYQALAFGIPWQSAFAHADPSFYPTVAGTLSKLDYLPLHDGVAPLHYADDLGGQSETNRLIAFAKRLRSAQTEQALPGTLERKVLDSYAEMDTAVEFFKPINAISNLQGSYPNTNLGNSLKDIAKTIKHLGSDPKPRIYLSGHPDGRWDTHDGQDTKFSGYISELANSLEALCRDIIHAGSWSETLIVTFSEFGRENKENGNRGSDHGDGGVSFLLGGSITNGGLNTGLISTYDPRAQNLSTAETLPVGIHFQNIFAQALTAMGLDATKIYDPAEYTPVELGIS